jgi:S-formylglutathione hydrolase FrmB
MGGYGAISLALAYPDVFAAAASHSGVLAPMRGTSRREVPTESFSLDALRSSYGDALWSLFAGPFGSDSAGLAARDPGRLAARLQSRNPRMMPALRADCGTGDGLLEQNRFFRDSMQRLGIPLEYAEQDGGHSWDYWRRHAPASAAWLATRLSVP